MNPDNKDITVETPDKSAGNPEVPAGGRRPRRRPLWWRIVKWVLVAAVGLALLLMAVLGLAVWILTPERLTPLVEKAANGYLDADVRIGRMELTYWSTFPSLEVQVDSVSVVSRSLRTLDPARRDSLPVWADSLLNVRGLRGKVDLPALALMRIELRDIVLDSPSANVVIINDSLTNFNIFPPSAPDKDEEPASVPDITLNRFTLKGGMAVRYLNAADSADVALRLAPTDLDGSAAPEYTLQTGGNLKARIGDIALPDDITFRFDGRIGWDHKSPMSLALDDCEVGVGPVDLSFSTLMDFSAPMRLNRLSVSLKPLDVSALLAWLPAEYTAQVKGLKTDMTISATAELTKPYTVGGKDLPSFDASVNIPSSAMSFQQMSLRQIELAATASFDAAAPQLSRLNVGNLTLVGEGVGVNFKGEATDLLNDPRIQGVFKGGISFGKVPSALMQMLPFTLKGLLTADATINLRPSYLDRLHFHQMKIDGEARLSDFRLHFNDSTGDIYSHIALLKFGSSSKVTLQNGQTADSLLTASLTVDTLAYDMAGMVINGAGMKLGLGISNKAVSADTTRVVPLGLHVAADRLRYENTPDSATVFVKSPSVYAVIQRYKDSARRPLLTAGVASRYLRYRSPQGRISLMDPDIKLRLHPNARPRMSKRLGLIFDSISALHPELRADSVYAMARRDMSSRRRGAARRHAQVNKADSTDVLDLRADKETRSLLQWWDASGSVAARRGRIITPYFPLRNSLSDLSLRFDMDSLVISDCRVRSGRSDFSIKGVVSNYTNAMLRKRAAMNIDFVISSDTIDVNQLVNASFYGAAYAENVAGDKARVSMSDTESDDNIQSKVDDTAADSVTGPLLVPMNLDATLRLNSKVALYEGLTLRDFHGYAMIHEGALQLKELGATTDAGSLSLNALYAAPTTRDMKLGVGMELRNFYIERFAKLFPALDSIMPALNTLSGRINAEMAATSDIEPNMDLNLGSLSALLTIKGDSLVVIDPDTYKSIAKWLLFKDKHHNMIDSISTQVAIENGQLEIYPFIFNFDRYKLGVMGHNDLAMNLNYHVSVLKSPIPFKFGINIKGTPEKMKIRLGGAKVKENMVAEKVSLVSDTRVNLVQEMDNVFRRGVRNARMKRLDARRSLPGTLRKLEEDDGTISAADSLMFIREGLIDAPPAASPATPAGATAK